MIHFFLFFLLSFNYAIAHETRELSIEAPATLEQLDQQGFHFSNVFNHSKVSNVNLYKSSKAYQTIVNSISDDLDKIKKNDKFISVTMSKKHRLFNKNWFKSKHANYDLVGIINRLDRADFYPSGCGETRFIYRLSYFVIQTKTRSRMPLTFNLVYTNSKNDKKCQSLIAGWNKIKNLNGEKLIKFLISKKSPIHLSKLDLKTVELNMQVVRWPSSIRPDMGGYAEYFLRVFKKKTEDHFILDHLENTPNIDLINSNPKLKSELLSWLIEKNNLKNLDNGILVIPKKYLAKKATSVALHGRSREFNKPFNHIFKKTVFKKLNLNQFKSFKTPYALMKRLNDLSCVGCHQGRTVAGFHFLGKDNKITSSVNSIYNSKSAHFINDQMRRANYMQQFYKQAKDLGDRPFSVRSDFEKGKYGSHCTLNKDISFSKWTCNKGLTCYPFDTNKSDVLGTCYEEKVMNEGSPCKVGVITRDHDPHRDRILNVKKVKCRDDLICEDTSVGFPGGMCSGDCTKLSENGVCGSIAVLYGFNQ